MPEVPRFITAAMLRTIRANTDWRALFAALGLERAKGKGNNNDWWALSPLSDEKTPSFHINDKGWYCHSTGEGGGVVELVQGVLARRSGRAVSCWDAGRWLLEQGVSRMDALPASDSAGAIGEKNAPRSEEKEKGRVSNRAESGGNVPITADLRPKLSPHHPELEKRGISKETCAYLGCGYLSGVRGTINNRIVFQVRGVVERGGALVPVILSHIGRAVSDVQADVEGKWHHYAHFKKHLELYNLDKLLLDGKAREQAKQTGRVVIVEGCFDVAKLVEAGIYNAAAAFGAHLSVEQVERVKLLVDRLGVREVVVWYDRDKAGREGAAKALDLLRQSGLSASVVWGKRDSRLAQAAQAVKIAATAKDPCDLSVVELRALRAGDVI
jgi:DNA primase